jgi:hypothetical protein
MKDNIKIDLKMTCFDVNWIRLAQDMHSVWLLFNMVLEIWIPQSWGKS